MNPSLLDPSYSSPSLGLDAMENDMHYLEPRCVAYLSVSSPVVQFHGTAGQAYCGPGSLASFGLVYG